MIAIETKILENLNTSVLLFNHKQELIYINTACQILFAVSERQLLGLTASELIVCPNGKVSATLMQAIENRRPFTERAMELPLPDQRKITVDCTVTPLYEEQNYNILVELRQVDRQIQISKEQQLLEQEQANRAFIRGMAHEIKNPLGGIRGATQLLEQELNRLELKEYTQIILQEVDRLKTLVDRMLGPNTLLRKRQVNIHEVLERVKFLIEVENDSNKVAVKCDYDPSIPELYADSDRLIQAILNIARNAAENFKQKGQITLKTRIHNQFSIANKKYRLVIQVDIIDNGPGISKTMQKHLFYPMVTGRANGTGLGLSIAQSLISQHQGLIECNSKVGNTVFTILLPLEDTLCK